MKASILSCKMHVMVVEYNLFVKAFRFNSITYLDEHV